MKEVTQYQCEICGRMHPDRESGEKCERKHLTPFSIAKCDYSFNGSSTRYPSRITIKFDDGRLIEYGKMQEVKTC